MAGGTAFSKVIYQQNMYFPEKEKFGITSQLLRAAISIPTTIAEGAARNTKKNLFNCLISHPVL